MIDQQKLRQDAEFVMENHNGSMAGTVAEWLLFILDHPTCLVPESHAVVPKPELLGLGVNDRRAGA